MSDTWPLWVFILLERKDNPVNMVRHSQFRMPNTKWGANILCRSKMADLVPLKFAPFSDIFTDLFELSFCNIKFFEISRLHFFPNFTPRFFSKFYPPLFFWNLCRSVRIVIRWLFEIKSVPLLFLRFFSNLANLS